MNKSICLLSAAVILLLGTICFAAPVIPSSELIAPPAIYVPYGGTITSELNLSDNDILGVVKQIIPAAAETADDRLGAAKQRGEQPSEVITILSNLDLKKLAESVDGIKAVRVIVAKYNTSTKPSEMMQQFTNGVAKAGSFTKIISDQGFTPGVAAVYAQENNGGYIGFMYDSKQKMLYAARIVGSVDISKVTQWAVNAAEILEKKYYMPKSKEAPQLDVPANTTTSDQ